MIGSFWNLCRTCPSMPVDKLHSEYRSTYRWHEYTGSRQDDVIRRPPQANGTVTVPGEIPNVVQNSLPARQEDSQNEMPKMEPALPRRKKHPELAYRHHEFLPNEDNRNTSETSSIVDRARSEERGGTNWRPSRRSKSEGPARTNPTETDNSERRRESDPDIDNTGRDAGLLRKAISKISTEYRLQFAWPQGHVSRRDNVDASTPRKSLSMGAIKPAASAIVHRKRTDHENKDESELEPLVNDNTIHEETREEKVQTDVDFKTEYKKKFRPFSQYEYADGRFLERTSDNKDSSNQTTDNNKGPWYREVVELRKKAGEYKHRGWGMELAPERIAELYNKQLELWDQVSQRSSLSALSLASTAHRSYTKDEKEESNKKSTPSKSLRSTESRIARELIRHHLERTTGGSEMDGLILSPTREKLEPTIPRKDDGYKSSKGSPQKSSPLKSSPQKTQKKSYQKSKGALKSARSHSVEPAEIATEKPKSPKRQSRSATVKEKRSSNSSSGVRRSRPSSLTTTVSSRSKSSSVSLRNEDKQQTKPSNKQIVSHVADSKEPGLGIGEATEPLSKTDKEESEEVHPNIEAIDLEPVVKSPPEPTRVKSPEQILVRSPDPVNWTVPLDTGKTFTVTQNIPEGDYGVRSHSEAKVWTPPEVPPPVAQSAPPQLPTEQLKEQARNITDSKQMQDQPKCTSTETKTVDEASAISETFSHPKACSSPTVDVSTPEEADVQLFSQVTPSSPQQTPCTPGGQSFASEMLEKARNRFDRFWRRNSKDSA